MLANKKPDGVTPEVNLVQSQTIYVIQKGTHFRLIPNPINPT